MKDSIVTVGVICPASVEYQTCRDLLKLSNETELMGRLVSSRSDKGIEIIAIQAGPGKIQSASATQLIIDKFEPEVIMDVGGAGALSPGVAISDIVCGEYIYKYDICAIEEFPQLAEDLTTKTILPDLSEEGKDILHQFAEQVKRERAIGFEVANIVSGEKNIKERTLREKLNTAFQAIACNWESSAILKTAKLNGVKAMTFRVITDNAGEEMSEELRANWRKTLSILYSVLQEFLLGSWLLRILNCLH